jgi:hypothetical protein
MVVNGRLNTEVLGKEVISHWGKNLIRELLKYKNTKVDLKLKMPMLILRKADIWMGQDSTLGI